MWAEELKKEDVWTCTVDKKENSGKEEKTIPEVLKSLKEQYESKNDEFYSARKEEYEELEKKFNNESKKVKSDCKSLLSQLNGEILEYKQDLKAINKIQKFDWLKWFDWLKSAIKSNSFDILEEDVFDLLRTSSPEEIKNKIDLDNTLSLPVDKDSFIRLKKALDWKNPKIEVKAEEWEKPSNNWEVSIEDEKNFNSIEKEFLSWWDLLWLWKENFTKSPKDVILWENEKSVVKKNYENLKDKLWTAENLKNKFPDLIERFNKLEIIFNNTKTIYDEIKSSINDKGNEYNNKSFQEVNKIAQSNDLKTLNFLKNQWYLEWKQFEWKGIVSLIDSFQENYDKLLLSSGSFDITKQAWKDETQILKEIENLFASKKYLVNFLSNPKNLAWILAQAKEKDEENVKTQSSQTVVWKAPQTAPSQTSVQAETSFSTGASQPVQRQAQATAVSAPKPQETSKPQYKHYNEVYKALASFDPEVANALKSFEAPEMLWRSAIIPAIVSPVESIVAQNVLWLEEWNKSEVTFWANENILVADDKDWWKVVANFESWEPDYSLVSENGFSVKMDPWFEIDEKVLELRNRGFVEQWEFKKEFTEAGEQISKLYKEFKDADPIRKAKILAEIELIKLKQQKIAFEATLANSRLKRDLSKESKNINTEKEKTKARNLHKLYEATWLAALPRNLVDDIMKQIETWAIIPDLWIEFAGFVPTNIDLDKWHFWEPLWQADIQKINYLKALTNKMFT